MTSLLCSCGNMQESVSTKNSNISVEQLANETAKKKWNVKYTTLSAFEESEDCKNWGKIYIPEINQEKYKFIEVAVYDDYYDYVLREIETRKRVTYRIYPENATTTIHDEVTEFESGKYGVSFSTDYSCTALIHTLEEMPMEKYSQYFNDLTLSEYKYTEKTDAEIVCIDENNQINYSSVDAFLDSDFYLYITEEGYPPYLLEWDETKYEFSKMWSDSGFYTYVLREIETNKSIMYQITVDYYIEDFETLYEKSRNGTEIITTAEMGGKTYDIMLKTSSYDSIQNYHLTYLPEKRYRASLSVGTETTQEEILEYFNDFTLYKQ